MQMTSPRNPDATAELRAQPRDRTSLLDALGKRAVLAKLEALRSGCLVLRRRRRTASFRQASVSAAGTHHHPRARLAALRRRGVRRVGRRGRGVHARLLDQRAARRRRAPVRAQHGRARRARRRARAAYCAVAQGGARAQTQQPRRLPPQHRRALRPRQRILPAVPRRDADVLGRHLRASAGNRCTTRRSRGSIASAASSIFGPTDHLLEIGTGWGGLALHAARDFGCRVTTTTISREQWTLARERVRERRPRGPRRSAVRGLPRSVRRSGNQYDKLVSIEMIEAIGAPVLRHLLRAMRRAAGAGRRDAAPGHHDCRPAL